MDQATWDRIEAKREQARYFEGLDKAAFVSQVQAKKAPPKRRRKAATKSAATSESYVKPGPARSTEPIGRCGSCGKQMRHRRDLGANFPDTVRQHSVTTCQPCHQRQLRGPSSRPRRPDACVGCGRPLRGKRDPKTPGTILHFGRGLCVTCASHRTREPKTDRAAPMSRPAECAECSSSFADGASYAARGLCRACYQKRARRLASADKSRPAKRG